MHSLDFSPNWRNAADCTGTPASDRDLTHHESNSVPQKTKTPLGLPKASNGVLRRMTAAIRGCHRHIGVPETN
jgi:hypothetical protein